MLVILVEEGMQILCSCHFSNSREVSQDLQHHNSYGCFRYGTCTIAPTAANVHIDNASIAAPH